MGTDFDTETLFSKAGGAGNTITSGTATSAHNNDNMDRFYANLIIGSGVFTTTSFAVLQSSIDGVAFQDIVDSTTTLSAAGGYAWNYANPAFNYFRINFTLGSGNFLAVTSSCRSIGLR